MIVGCAHVHACRAPLGMARSTQFAPLHVVAFGGMLDGVGGPSEHPFTVLVVGAAAALFGCRCVIFLVSHTYIVKITLQNEKNS